MATRLTVIAHAAFGAVLFAAPALGQATTVPKPTPIPGVPSAATKPVTPPPAAATAQDGSRIDPRLAGVPIYPGAELLTSFDAGGGQFLFLFGTDMPYSDIVGYYKTQFRVSGSEVFRSPAMQQFDLGQFRSESMAYRPSVVVKDYAGTDTSGGYLHVTGTTEKRYRTIIQIVR